MSPFWSGTLDKHFYASLFLQDALPSWVVTLSQKSLDPKGGREGEKSQEKAGKSGLPDMWWSGAAYFKRLNVTALASKGMLVYLIPWEESSHQRLKLLKLLCKPWNRNQDLEFFFPHLMLRFPPILAGV